MAKEKSPAFQFYPDDWRNDEHVQVMTLEEKGAYIDLLCVCWKEQSIPTDTKRLSRLLGVSPRKAKTLWLALSARFNTPNGDGRTTHPRLERERDKQTRFREHQRNAGLMSAAKRSTEHQPRLQSGSGSPVNPRKVNPSVSVSISDLRSPHTRTAREDDPGRFWDWWTFTAYPRHRNARYMGNQRTDHDNVLQMLAVYSLAELQQIAEVFLQIPDDAEPWLKGKTRTLGMLRSKASAIEERLKARAK